MSEKNLKVGVRVEVTGKELLGTVAYVGMTSFAVGKWVGVVLDEPKGKNNGTIKGQSYFECGENHGMFVRPTQLRVIGVSGSSDVATKRSSAEDITGSATPTQPTRARLSGSRTSLSSSRQSLLGSRSQLTMSLSERSPNTTSVPSNAKRCIQPPSISARDSISAIASNAATAGAGNAAGETHAASKRASFVETGFLEILKPQFTTSQPMRSPSFTAPTAVIMPTSEEKAAAAEQVKLIEELRAQVQELTEKLETLKQWRSEDKERLREFDKMKIQFEQMQEFRTKIMASQTLLQRDLQRAKQEAKDAIEARERHAQEMSELADNVELITLDKEMAEEKADTLQLELDSARERVEELQVDLELLRSEMQNKAETDINTAGVNVNADGQVVATSYEFKQLEQQNSRLKETLVRLRDLSAHDKHDIQKLTKELETKKSEVLELERTKEKLSAHIDELEATVADLQEQVDAALGAEEMVEQLAEKKMELEDKVKLLEAEVVQLEALEDVHEQLMESNHELQMDLREELDMANTARKDVLRERDAAIETIYDRDQTIIKFRELVQKLNEQLLELRDRNSSNDQKSLQDTTSLGSNKLGETIDYKQMFAESKAYTRAIDVQLRQIELTQANEHVQMLTAFMPESFMSRGGDHDAILVILLISRLVYKCGIIVSQTRERFPVVEQVTQEAVIQGHAVEQYGFKCRLMHYIHNLQCALHQILYGLNVCQSETLLRAGNSLPEMVAQEKTIDGIIELLKLNQLDENSPTENIEKCVTFFNAMNTVLLAGEDLLNETQLIRDCMASLSSACEATLNDVAIARAITKEDSSDLALLLQFVAEQTEAIKQQAKIIKRRLPQDQHISKCGISLHRLEALRQHMHNFGRIMSSIHVAIKQALQTIVASIESDNSAEHAMEQSKFWQLLSAACERIYEQDDRGPSQNFKGALAQANNEMQQVAQYLLDKEYEIMSLAQQKQQSAANQGSPIILRAQFIKKQLEQKNVLAATLENREADIKQLKLAAKMKQNELSEMQIRKDLAEKKLSVLQSEYEHAVDKWKRQYDETAQLLKQKEKEFEETMDHLQNDIETLESEKSKLREKLKSSGLPVGVGVSLPVSMSHGKRNTAEFSSLSMSPGSANNSLVNVSSTSFNAATHFNASAMGATPLVVEELQLLRSACAQERQQRLQLQAEGLRQKLRNFDPIFVPQPKDKRILDLEQQLTRVKHDWALSMLQAAKPRDQLHGQNYYALDSVAMQRRNLSLPPRVELSTRANHLATEILSEYLHRHPHRAAPSEFANFPTVEVKRMLKI